MKALKKPIGGILLKRAAVALMAMLGCAFAQNQNLQGAISSLESTTRAFMLASSAILLVAGLFFGAAGAFIYLRRIKGSYKPAAWVKAAAFALGGLGVICLLAGMLGLAVFLLAPALIRGLLVAPG